MITSVEQLLAFFTSREILRNNNIVCHGFKISVADAEHIKEQLNYDFWIEKITFFECDISDESAKALVSGLSHHVRLKQLTVSHCLGLSPKGAIEFARLMQTCKLDKLALNNLAITDDDAKKIIEMLEHNRILKELHLTNNTLNDLTPFVTLLKSNRYIVTLNVANNPLQNNALIHQQLKLVLQENCDFRNHCRFTGALSTRHLFHQYHNLINTKYESLSMSHLREAFQHYGLNTIPKILEQELIAIVYHFQLIVEALKAKSPTFNMQIALTVAQFLLGSESHSTPPASYTNALARLNQQRILFRQEKDEAALAINLTDRRRLSLFPLEAHLVQPSYFWWAGRKLGQLTGYKKSQDKPDEPEKLNPVRPEMILMSQQATEITDGNKIFPR